jgi:hypothetical protein
MSKDILTLAREAGWPIEAGEELPHTGSMCLERFAELVRADEREACMNALNALPYQRSTKYDCMDVIRARRNT